MVINILEHNLYTLGQAKDCTILAELFMIAALTRAHSSGFCIYVWLHLQNSLHCLLWIFPFVCISRLGTMFQVWRADNRSGTEHAGVLNQSKAGRTPVDYPLNKHRIVVRRVHYGYKSSTIFVNIGRRYLEETLLTTVHFFLIRGSVGRL